MTLDSTISTFINNDPLLIFLALFGTFISLFGLVSYLIKEKLFLSESLVATLFGILIGPYCLNWVNFQQLLTPNGLLDQNWSSLDSLLLYFTRIIISIQVMAAGVTLPKKYLKEKFWSLMILVLPIMTIGWLITSGFICLFLRLSFLESLILAACLTPTDPILANSLLKGRFADKHIPLHLRYIISGESGANDGLGFPFLFLPLYLLFKPTGQAIGDWFLYIWLKNILFSILIGFLIGYIARILLKKAESYGWIDKESFLAYAIGLALLTSGLVGWIGSDDLLACFIVGNSFTWDDHFRIKTLEANFQETIDMLFNTSFLIFFGSILPFSQFSSIGIGNLFGISILTLLLKRLPWILLSYKLIPEIKTIKEALFNGWFGPIGVSALFYMQTAKLEFLHFNQPALISYLFPVITFMVLSSIVLHGLTVPLFHFGVKQIQNRRSLASSPSYASSIPPLDEQDIDQFIALDPVNRITSFNKE